VLTWLAIWNPRVLTPNNQEISPLQDVRNYDMVLFPDFLVRCVLDCGGGHESTGGEGAFAKPYHTQGLSANAQLAAEPKIVNCAPRGEFMRQAGGAQAFAWGHSPPSCYSFSSA
jgi:hypothetical protein